MYVDDFNFFHRVKKQFDVLLQNGNTVFKLVQSLEQIYFFVIYLTDRPIVLFSAYTSTSNVNKVQNSSKACIFMHYFAGLLKTYQRNDDLPLNDSKFHLLIYTHWDINRFKNLTKTALTGPSLFTACFDVLLNSIKPKTGQQKH